ncbi:MAG: cysteine dioxygenase [Sciscionella sp.]
MFAVPANTVASAASPASLTAVHPARIAIDCARDRSQWAQLLRYDPDERYAALIERTVDYEIWLLSWLPGQHTELHDHGGATGAFTVVTGTLSESVIGRDNMPVRHTVGVGQSRVFGPHYVHQVSNSRSDPAVSIHVYRPERGAMTPYLWDPVSGLSRRG